MTVTLDDYLHILDRWWLASGQPMSHATRTQVRNAWPRYTQAERDAMVAQMAAQLPVELNGHRAGGHQSVAPRPTEPLRLFGTTDSSDLREADVPVEWLLRGLLVDPTYGEMAGEMKTLKTYVAGFMAIAVASGTKLFDRFEPTRAAPVLMYVGEGGRQPHKRRLRRIARAMGVDLDDLAGQLHRSYDVAPLDSVRYQASLAADLERIRPHLFILDPLYAFHGTGAEASNLHQEGAHLNNAVHLAREAGTTAMIVNHFNQTGSGGGLKRITQAGSGEWVDSWLLLSHREPPDVDEGQFHLSLEVGSRQWGGTTWDLDLSIGRFDTELGAHEGDIEWSLQPAGSAGHSRPAQRIVDAVTSAPGAHTKEELARLAGGRIIDARRLITTLEQKGEIHARLVTAARSDGRAHRTWRFFAGSSAVPSHVPSDDTTQEGHE